MAILKPEPELGVLADRPQPLVGLLGQDLVGREQQIGVGPLAGPAHPAPQLVELAQAEAVGPVDDQGVDGRHVDARLDDRRADQHVVAAFPEVEDDPLERPFVHLAVGDRHPGLGHQGPQLGGRPSRWSPPGCGRRTPGPRAAAPGGCASATARSSYSPT